jgi:uncharacterized membrane protein (UPF0127 family)
VTGRAVSGLVLLLLVGSGCGATGSSLPAPQSGWPTTSATLDGRILHLVVAEDHGIGMRGVTDLGHLDGMLFAYAEPVDPSGVRFSMQGLTIDLDAHFFNPDGLLIDTVPMAACPADPCPSYGPAEPFRWVVEAPAGALDVPAGARLVVAGGSG